MNFFTFFNGGWRSLVLLSAAAFVAIATPGRAQTDTNSAVPAPGEISLNATTAPPTNTPATNAPAASAPTAPEPASQVPVVPVATPSAMAVAAAGPTGNALLSGPLLGALLTLASLGGFLLYQCGLTRAKNSGHTCMLLLVGVLFGVTGYWIGGFAVQMGGIGDTHAALSEPIPFTERSALNHELGPVVFNHHWGLMGSSGFFLMTDDSARDGAALLFLVQAAMLTIVLAAALGGALERGKILALAFCSYLVGVLIYPLLANWVWGGGWLAELGREFGLGHGFVDLGGAGVVHETAGVLALVYAVVLGPRHTRFGRNAPSFSIPGHNVPFIVLGSLILLGSWMSSNAFASAGLLADTASPANSGAGVAAVNTLLAALGGLVASFIQSAWQKSRPEPARLCRGLLGGAVSSCGGAALLDPWAAFLIGCIAALLIQQAVIYLVHKRIDDTAGTAAVHAAGGAWGVFAVGLFANGSSGDGLNGVPREVRGLFYGGAWHQLAAQVLGGITGFVVVCILGYACVGLVQRILGNRVELAEEAGGLDWGETGALGYQGDVDGDEENAK